jgi:hypothetical protein
MDAVPGDREDGIAAWLAAQATKDTSCKLTVRPTSTTPQAPSFHLLLDSVFSYRMQTGRSTFFLCSSGPESSPFCAVAAWPFCAVAARKVADFMQLQTIMSSNIVTSSPWDPLVGLWHALTLNHATGLPSHLMV